MRRRYKVIKVSIHNETHCEVKDRVDLLGNAPQVWSTAKSAIAFPVPEVNMPIDPRTSLS